MSKPGTSIATSCPCLRNLPAVAFAARQPLANAVAATKVVGGDEWCSSREIRRRCNDYEAKIIADAHRHHVARDRLAKPYSGIETLLDDIDEPSLRDQIERHAGEALQKTRHHRFQQQPRRTLIGIDPERAARIAARIGDGIQCLVKIAEHRCKPREQCFAGFCRRYATRRAIEQAHAQFALQCEHGVT